MLTFQEKDILINIAREAIRARLEGGAFMTAEPPHPALNEKRGAFVSIHMGGMLRGCIGSFVSEGPLYRTVAEMAVAAAFDDPRFMPLKKGELSRIRVEISVLSPLKEVSDPSEIVVGRHGVFITKGLRRGVLLPQVATEHGFDRERFLDETCVKAGLRPGEWRKGASICSFEAEIIKEVEKNL